MPRPQLLVYFGFTIVPIIEKLDKLAFVLHAVKSTTSVPNVD